LKETTMRPDTELVRFDACPEDPFRPTSTPIYQTATFEQSSALDFGRYDYTRSGNPTRAVLEEQLARLEGGGRAFAFTSGMAALATLVRLLPAGSHVVAGDDVYGGTHRLLEHIAPRAGIETSYARTTSVASFERALRPETRLVLVESPTNPLLEIADLVAIGALAHRHGAILAVDSSLMSPWLQRPLELGADVVVHSATKFLCGHADTMAGALVVRDEGLARELAFAQNAEGTALAPFDCWLLLRGMKTLGVRLERAQRTALVVARFLEAHAAVEDVLYPGIEAHPGRELHLRQARGPGSVLSFRTGDPELSRLVVESLRHFTLAVSFGSIASTASLPCRMSHRAIPEDVRAARGLTNDLIRLSIGLEDERDLVEDLAAALEIPVAAHR
jgi:cystathionine beta-lyase